MLLSLAICTVFSESLSWNKRCLVLFLWTCETRKDEASTWKLCAMPSPSALIKHMESDKVLSQACVHVRVRKSSSCPLDVTVKKDFTGSGKVKSWKQQELRGRLKKNPKNQKTRLPNILGYIHSAPLFLLLFHSLFFQNRFSPLSSVESKKEMGKEAFAISESHLHSHFHTIL